jgi:hypothetical protein
MCQMRTAIAAVATIILSTAFTTSAPQFSQSNTFDFKRSQAVYVVAVKTKPSLSLWPELGPAPRPGDRVVTFPDQPAASDRPTLERSLPERTTLDRQAPELELYAPADPELRARVETEFRKQKWFRLVDSIESSDFIFFIRAEYIFFYSEIGPRGGGVVVMGSSDGRINENRLVRLRATVLSVPGFRQLEKGLAGVGDVAQWLGTEVGDVEPRRIKEASPERLVRQFHKKAKK